MAATKNKQKYKNNKPMHRPYLGLKLEHKDFPVYAYCIFISEATVNRVLKIMGWSPRAVCPAKSHYYHSRNNLAYIPLVTTLGFANYSPNMRVDLDPSYLREATEAEYLKQRKKDFELHGKPYTA